VCRRRQPVEDHVQKTQRLYLKCFRSRLKVFRSCLKVVCTSKPVVMELLERVEPFRLTNQQFSLLPLQVGKPSLESQTVLPILFLHGDQARLARNDELHCSIQFFGCHAFPRGNARGMDTIAWLTSVPLWSSFTLVSESNALLSRRW